MATPPSLVSGGGNTLGTGWCSGSWAATTNPQTASITVAVGDIIVLACAAEAAAASFLTPTNTGTAFTWTLRTNDTLNGSTGIYTATATAAQTTTVSVGCAIGQDWGFEYWVWRGSSGVGVAASTSMATAAQLGASFTGANSAGIFISSDSNAGATSPTWLSVNGTPMVTAAFLAVSSHYSIRAAHSLNCGPPSPKTLGMSAPTGAFGVSIVEILGSAGTIFGPSMEYTAPGRTWARQFGHKIVVPASGVNPYLIISFGTPLFPSDTLFPDIALYPADDINATATVQSVAPAPVVTATAADYPFGVTTPTPRYR